MNLYFRRQLPHSRSYLDEFQTNRIELDMGQFASLKMVSPGRMQKNISHRVEKQAKLVGFKTAAGGPVGEQMIFVLFYEKLHRSPSAVDNLIDKPPVPVLQIGHNKSHKRPKGVLLHLDDNPLGLRPVLRAIEKLIKDLYRSLLLSLSPPGFLHKRLYFFLQRIIRLESQNKFHPLLTAELIDCRTTVIRVTPQEDPYLRPRLPDLLDHPLEDRDNLLARRSLPRPQYRRDQPPAFARMMGLEVCTIPYYSPESNGMAEAFIKWFKRDYVHMNELPDAITVMEKLALWFEDYNENHPHKGLKMMSPREHKKLMERLEDCPVQ